MGLDGTMVGESAPMSELRELIARIGPTDSRVLITGESGTGKELVAAAIHEASTRRDRAFIRVNCAAIPRDLVESEMFGHELWLTGHWITIQQDQTAVIFVGDAW
jgi:two-component system nitrogen regulation response regulator NtrX